MQRMSLIYLANRCLAGNLISLKDPVPMTNKSGVYKILCGEWSSFYMGQTEGKLRKWISEHRAKESTVVAIGEESKIIGAKVSANYALLNNLATMFVNPFVGCFYTEPSFRDITGNCCSFWTLVAVQAYYDRWCRLGELGTEKQPGKSRKILTILMVNSYFCAFILHIYFSYSTIAIQNNNCGFFSIRMQYCSW